MVLEVQGCSLWGGRKPKSGWQVCCTVHWHWDGRLLGWYCTVSGEEYLRWACEWLAVGGRDRVAASSARTVGDAAAVINSEDGCWTLEKLAGAPDSPAAASLGISMLDNDLLCLCGPSRLPGPCLCKRYASKGQPAEKTIIARENRGLRCISPATSSDCLRCGRGASCQRRGRAQ